jgi:hypothetical protein
MANSGYLIPNSIWRIAYGIELPSWIISHKLLAIEWPKGASENGVSF